MSENLNIYLKKWDLSEPQPLATTATSHLYTVRHKGETAVLKLITPYGFEERVGAAALSYWDGHGAARLLCADNDGQLIEYIEGGDLVALVERGEDETATRIIAGVLNELHSVQGTPPGELYPLRRWFRELFKKADADRLAGVESIYVRGAKVAEALLADPREERVLHGDIHHANIRHGAARGWLAFDPKGLFGERTYDCANSLCNPYRGVPRRDPIVHNEQRLLTNAGILADEMGIDLARVLAFTFAYGCLSASWSLNINDEDAAAWALGIAELAEPHLQPIS